MGQGGDERRGMMGRDGWGIIGERKFVKGRMMKRGLWVGDVGNGSVGRQGNERSWTGREG